MSRKDYIKIADCIKNCIRIGNLDGQQQTEVIVNFATMLKLDNPRFCAIRFGAYISGVDTKLPELHSLDQTL